LFRKDCQVDPNADHVRGVGLEHDGERKLDALVVNFVHSRAFNHFPDLVKTDEARVERDGPALLLILAGDFLEVLLDN